jgi:hypothetical protein
MNDMGFLICDAAKGRVFEIRSGEPVMDQHPRGQEAPILGLAGFRAKNRALQG